MCYTVILERQNIYHKHHPPLKPQVTYIQRFWGGPLKYNWDKYQYRKDWQSKIA
jgi:hypothetical protein